MISLMSGDWLATALEGRLTYLSVFSHDCWHQKAFGLLSGFTSSSQGQVRVEERERSCELWRGSVCGGVWFEVNSLSALTGSFKLV